MVPEVSKLKLWAEVSSLSCLKGLVSQVLTMVAEYCAARAVTHVKA